MKEGGREVRHDNNKRIAFLEHADRARLEQGGWHVQHAREVASSPEAHFDARRILTTILDTALAPATEALRA